MNIGASGHLSSLHSWGVQDTTVLQKYKIFQLFRERFSNLNPVVVLVSDDDAVVAVAADAGWPIELSVLLPADAELVMEDPLRCEDLDAVVGAVGDQDEAFLGAADAPRATKLPVFLALGSEREDGRADVVVVATGPNLKPGEPTSSRES